MNPRCLTVAVLCASALSAQAAISFGTQAPSADEQLSMSLINRFRADPQGELARMLGVTPSTLTAAITPSTTAWTAGFWTHLAAPGTDAALAMDFFRVNPGQLLEQWSLLPAAGTLVPYTWNGNLGQSAQGYAEIVVADAGTTLNPHLISPYNIFGAERFNDAGYTSLSAAGENIARNFPNGVAYQHAGFAVDWGNTASGIQTPAGHRDNMLSSDFTELGVGIVDGYGGGKTTQVQHFGNRFASASEFVWGYAWADAALGSYSFGEGLPGLTVKLFDATHVQVGSTTTDANGGFTLQVAGLGDGAYEVDFYNAGTEVGSRSVHIANAGLYNANLTLASAPIPEPGSRWLLALGAAVLLKTARGRKNACG